MLGLIANADGLLLGVEDNLLALGLSLLDAAADLKGCAAQVAGGDYALQDESGSRACCSERQYEKYEHDGIDGHGVSPPMLWGGVRRWVCGGG